MTINGVDVSKLQREIAILTTNSVELQNKMYEIFVNNKPCMVDLRVWTDNGFETIKIPNLALSRIPVQYGTGNPNVATDIKSYSDDGAPGNGFGTVYIDIAEGAAYIKVSESTWFQFASMKEIEDHDRDEYAHNSVLASINGNSEEQFAVGSTDRDSDKNYAVNIESLDYFLGHTKNLCTTEKVSIVDAINEAMFTSEKEAACIVDVGGNRVVGTSKPRIFKIIITDLGEISLTVATGLKKFHAIKKDGTKYTCEDAESIPPQTNLAGSKMTIFLDIAGSAPGEDATVPVFVCIPDGNYYISETRPLRMKEGDVWLDTGCRPYEMYKIKVVDNKYEDEEVNYIYLGTIEKV